MNSGISRRGFLGGVTAFGGLSAFKAAAGSFSSGTPNLKVGIISDLHVRWEPLNNRICGYSDASTVKHAFEYFRDQCVDAVVIPGDFTDYGQIREMQEVANMWFEVFPDNKGLDGETVEKIFVFGNHEWDMFPTSVEKMRECYGGETEEECLTKVMKGNPAQNWKDIWGEDFAPIYLKDVKGYKFIATHWIDDDDYSGMYRFKRAIPFVESIKSQLPTDKPFFHVQHPHPTDTCFAGTYLQDYGAVAAAYKGFNNLVCLTGHSHYSITDDRSIWQGDYTAINCGCMRWTFPPTDFIQAPGWANAASYYNTAAVDPYKLMPSKWADWKSRQGMLMEVYDDYIVFHRRDFYADLPLGDDWVVPTGTGADTPYTIARQTAELPAPQFPNGAKLSVSRVKAKTRGSSTVDSVEKDALKIVIPQANAVAKGRPFTYDVAVVTDAGRTSLMPAVDIGFNHGPADSAFQIPMDYLVAQEELPQTGVFKIEVTPKGWYGTAGLPLVSGSLSLEQSSSIQTVKEFVFLNPDTSSFWRTATGPTLNLPIDFPKGATTAMLAVVGVGYSQVYNNITERKFQITLPSATSPETENVYDLTLTFDDPLATVRQAKIGFVNGTDGTATGSTRIVLPKTSSNWPKVSDRAVLPIPCGTTSLTVDGKSVETGLNGAQGWQAIGPVAGNEAFSVAIAGSYGNASALLKPMNGFFIMIQ